MLEAELLEQQRPPGGDGGLGELQLADVALGEHHAVHEVRVGVRAVQHEHPLLAELGQPRRPGRVRPRRRPRRSRSDRWRRAARPSPARPPRRRVPSRTARSARRRRSRRARRPAPPSSGVSLTTSMAPSSARMPHLIAPPSNAGPAGAAVARMRSPSLSTISQLVPTSMKSRVRLSRSMPRREHAGHDVAADVGTQRREARAPGRRGCTGSPSSLASTVGGTAVDSTNGATPIGSGSMPSASAVIVALPASAAS